jgi:hypothetical protein
MTKRYNTGPKHVIKFRMDGLVRYGIEGKHSKLAGMDIVAVSRQFPITQGGSILAFDGGKPEKDTEGEVWSVEVMLVDVKSFKPVTMTQDLRYSEYVPVTGLNLDEEL